MTMAQAVGRGLTELLVDVASLYPKVLRSGVGYWTEMVVNASGYAADMVETAVAVARKPRQTREALAELLDRYRAYLVSSGDTLERAILDFNQAVVSVARPSSQTAAAPGDPRIVEVFEELADFATTGRSSIGAARAPPTSPRSSRSSRRAWPSFAISPTR